jgi:site-specific DNA-methyltransferase (adenine-specific)
MILLHGDCLDLLSTLEAGSVDAIIADLPYGTTQNRWDAVIPFDAMWKAFDRVCKPNAAIVLTAQSIFTAALISSNSKSYRYSLVWEKSKAGGFLNARRMPLQSHEDIAVFYQSLPTYNPQMEPGKPYTKRAKSDGDGGNYGKFQRAGTVNVNEGMRFPRSVIRIPNDNHGSLHPTQKPVALMEYLIRTYTNEGETVLDPTMGSGTTGVACVNTGRRFIGIERDAGYFDIAQRRIAEAQNATPLLQAAE